MAALEEEFPPSESPKQLESGISETDDDRIPVYYYQLNREWKDSLYATFLSREDEPNNLILKNYIDIDTPDMRSYTFNEHETHAITNAIENIRYLIEENKKKPEYKKLTIIKLCKDIGFKTVPRFTTTHNINISISNDSEFNDEIGDSKELEVNFKHIKDRIIDLNRVKKDDYDIILYLAVHGAIKPETPNIINNCIDDSYNKDGEKIPGKFPVHTHDPTDSTITFLTATLPGICHILQPTYLLDKVRRNVDDQLSKGTLYISDLQNLLRDEKQAYVNEKLGEKSQITHDKEWDSFAKHIGWRISTNKWVNKIYQEDTNLGETSFVVLHSSIRLPPDIFVDVIRDTGRSTVKLRDNPREVTKTEVCDYLITKGFKNILIIDSACGTIWGNPNERVIRAIQLNSIREGVAGGKKKKSTKSKRKNKRKTKRNKHRQ